MSLAAALASAYGASPRGWAGFLSRADFIADLLYTAVPQRAASGTTGTFTRATTSTWPNNDGYSVTGVAGEIGFPGARRIRNHISASSEDFSNAAWTKLSTTVVVNQAVAPDGTATADLVYPTTSGTDRVVYQNGLVSTVVGDKMILEIYAKYAGIQWLWFGTLGGGTSANQLPFFDLQNGVVGQAGTYFNSASIEDEGDGWYRCIAIKNAIAAAPLFPIYGFGDADGSTTVTANGTDGLYLWGAQVEDVTAQTTQTAGEYVSVGVESAPYYHGSMVDGVKCFPTDLSGNPLTTMLGYSAEGARTNLCLQSQDFATTWAVTDATISVNTKVAADGTTTADSLVENAAAATAHFVTQAITKAASSAAYTLSVYVEKGGRDWVALTLYDNTALGARAWFNVNTGVVGSTANIGAGMGTITANIESVGGGIYRCKMSVSASGTATRIDPYIYSTNADAVLSVNGINAVGLYLWGAQLELGSFASSYIPTTTAAVTRNADVLTYSSAGNIDGTKGWCYAEASAQWSAATGVYNILVGIDTANRGPLLAIDNAPTAIYIADGTNAVQATGASTTFNSTSKRASTWGGSTMSVTGSGAAVASGAFDGNMNVGANITVGILDNGGSAWFGTIRNVRIGQRQLSASELQAITS